MPNHYAMNPQTGERIMLVDGKWVPATPASAASVMKPVTEAQAKDGFNAKRMTAAGETISGLEGDGYDAGLGRLAAVPGLGALPISDVRSYNAAQAEWADSILRMTTGAAATKDEVAQMGKAYFPQFGDDEAVRRQKAEARKRVEADAMARAGPAGMAKQGPQEHMRSNRAMAADMGRARAGPQAAPQGQQLTPEQAAKLPSGTRFIGTDGVARVRH